MDAMIVIFAIVVFAYLESERTKALKEMHKSLIEAIAKIEESKEK